MGKVEATPGKSALLRYERKGLLWVALYLLVILSPLLLAKAVAPRTDHPFLVELGKGFALISFGILACQFVLSSRWPELSRPYGLDMVLRFHKGMAVFSLLLLSCHPILLAAGTGKWQLLYSPALPWPVWLGKIGLLLLFGQAVSSLWQKRLLSFEHWRRLHNQAGLILGLAVIHSGFLGEDLERWPLQLLWAALAGLAAGFYGYHKIYQPRFTGRNLLYTVHEVRRETHNVRTIVLTPPAGKLPPPYLPGQFHFLTFYRGNARYDGEEHHFTISSSPTRKGILSSTIKASGDFTKSLAETPPGSKVRVEGPFGRFSYLLADDGRELVFLAGGIGITPFMSMLRHLRDTGSGRGVILLYANRREEDILFREELAEIAAQGRPRLKPVHVLSRPPRGWPGEDGHIDREMIRRHCGIDLQGKTYFLCCPPEMMEVMVKILKGLGVKTSRIHAERFWL